MRDKAFLLWIVARLVHHFKVPRDTDYVGKLRSIALKMDQQQCTPNTAGGLPTDLYDDLREIRKLAIRPHDISEDPYYSCPLSEEGCANDFVDQSECNCGATDHNIKFQKVYERLEKALRGDCE